MAIIRFVLGALCYLAAYVVTGAIYAINGWAALTHGQSAAIALPLIVAVISSLAVDKRLK